MFLKQYIFLHVIFIINFYNIIKFKNKIKREINMKKLIVTTLVISLIVLGFGVFSVEAQSMEGSKMGNRGINDDTTRPDYQRDFQDSTCFLDLEKE